MGYLQGEITVDKRPVNSVLESVVHIDKNTLFNHQSSQITFEHTKTLDDKIKKRIVEMRFDNVIHTIQSSDTNEKKVCNTDYKKAKIRFVALYDEAFELALQNNVFYKINDSLNTKEKKKIQTIFKALCTSLNELSTPFASTKLNGKARKTICNQ